MGHKPDGNRSASSRMAVSWAPGGFGYGKRLGLRYRQRRGLCNRGGATVENVQRGPGSGQRLIEPECWSWLHVSRTVTRQIIEIKPVRHVCHCGRASKAVMSRRRGRWWCELRFEGNLHLRLSTPMAGLELAAGPAESRRLKLTFARLAGPLLRLLRLKSPCPTRCISLFLCSCFRLIPCLLMLLQYQRSLRRHFALRLRLRSL